MVCENVKSLMRGCQCGSKFGLLLTTVIENGWNQLPISNTSLNLGCYKFRLGRFGGSGQITIMQKSFGEVEDWQWGKE